MIVTQHVQVVTIHVNTPLTVHAARGGIHVYITTAQPKGHDDRDVTQVMSLEVNMNPTGCSRSACLHGNGGSRIRGKG